MLDGPFAFHLLLEINPLVHVATPGVYIERLLADEGIEVMDGGCECELERLDFYPIRWCRETAVWVVGIGLNEWLYPRDRHDNRLASKTICSREVIRQGKLS